MICNIKQPFLGSKMKLYIISSCVIGNIWWQWII